MTDTADVAGSTVVPGDAFVAQVNWLVAVTGGKEQLAQRSGGLVSVRTLDNWTAGNYPRTKVTGAVRELDMWARTQLPGYPTAAGVPSLIESCGPASRNGGPVVADEVIRPVPDEPTAPPSRRWRRWALMAAAQLSVIGAAVLVTLLVVDEEESAAAPDGTAAANELVNLPLPSTGDGRLRQEEAGSIGANTYADPRTLEGGGPAIPPNTVLEVRCRYYAPSVPSVTPDGFWYLIETAEWNGLWSPANSFMNGDVPGGPYIHNTDFDVPVCE